MAYERERYIDPRLYWQGRERKKCCPNCYWNRVASQDSTGWRIHECFWNEDQKGGTRGEHDCKRFLAGAKLRKKHAKPHD